MTSGGSHGPDDPWAPTHPGHPLVDDASAAVLDEAVVELTLLRSPMSLGDGLADLHAMVSLLAQLHEWIPLSVAAARNQDHTWDAIGRQLGVTATTARRRHRARVHLSAAPGGGPSPRRIQVSPT